MRIPLLACALLSCAVVSHSQGVTPVQGATPAGGSAAQSWNWSLPQRDATNKLPSGWHVDFNLPLKMPALTPAPKVDRWSSSIDSKCIVHPPKASQNAFSAGEPFMQDRYPGLMKMPVQGMEGKTEARVEGIPTQWPALRVEAIPVEWPKLSLEDLERTTPPQVQPKP